MNYQFFYNNEDDCAEKYQVEKPGIILIRQFLEPQILHYIGELDREELTSFTRHSSVDK